MPYAFLQAEESKMLRNKGNSAYGKKQFQAALAHYSQSILQAPLKSREAALSLGNRYIAEDLQKSSCDDVVKLRPVLAKMWG